MFRKSFSCPKIKTDFVTGKSIADLSPEDVGIIAAMGDSLAVSYSYLDNTSILTLFYLYVIIDWARSLAED